MEYRLYAIQASFQKALQHREDCFLKLLDMCDEKQQAKFLASFDALEIYQGCISLLEDDTININKNDITMYRFLRDEFFHMRVHEHYIEMNRFIDSPFYHYLTRLHKEYIIVDEFDKVHYQKYCKNI